MTSNKGGFVIEKRKTPRTGVVRRNVEMSARTKASIERVQTLLDASSESEAWRRVIARIWALAEHELAGSELLLKREDGTYEATSVIYEIPPPQEAKMRDLSL